MYLLLSRLVVLALSLSAFGAIASAQEISVSDKLSVSALSDGIYLHTSDNNNGIVVFSDGQALAISTPATDAETQALINWITKEMNATLVGFVADRWHPDAMGGLETVRRNSVQTYAHHRTRQIARERGLPVPEIGFEDRLEIDVGGKTVALDFLGEAHTHDGIVAWIPDDRVLFGGNGVRDADGWVGNIGDANLEEWSQTIANIQERYGNAAIVVPGHGAVGGPELLSSTRAMYAPFARSPTEQMPVTMPCAGDASIIIEQAGSDLKSGDVRSLEAATILIQDAFKTVRVSSPAIRIRTLDDRITALEGQLEIFDRHEGVCTLRSALTFDRLFLVNVDQFVGLAVVLKEASPIS